MTRAAVVVLAGGSGTRVGASAGGSPLNKVYLPLAGREVLAWSLAAACGPAEVERLVLVVRPEDTGRAARMVADHPVRLGVELVTGGSTRHGSEEAALAHLAPAVEADELDVVVIHDGARPLAPPALFTEVIEVAARDGGALPAVPAGALITSTGSGGAGSGGAGSGGGLVRVQTPQAFRAGPLLAAYRAAARHGFEGTDTASTVERFTGLTVRAVPSSVTNLKVTYPADVAVAAALLASRASA